MAEPENVDEAVKVTEQEAVPTVALATRPHVLAGLKLPDPVVAVQLTEPEGVTGDPAAEVSLTVAVQLVD